ncbi:Alpha-glucosidase [Fusarium oxysporum f. sp. conglutinans]|nr:Alpha-glucosidase [Fusarium oxysporum f. sp. conglutinans]
MAFTNLQEPQVDMGYDISDYYTIDPPYGDVSDVDVLKDKLHERGMKLVLDLVMNHTSDQHEWFRESRKSKDNPYRDWYIWKPAKYDSEGNRHPPNNWDAHFQGSAWEYDETTDEYYLCLFCKQQPDLNWENPAVRKQVHDVMRFWLDRGTDGFRMDVINFVSKDQAFPDSDKTFLKEIGAILQEYDAFSVGEMPCVHDERELIKAVRGDRGELSMIFHFELMDLDHGVGGKFTPRSWDLSELKSTTLKWQKFMYDNEGWNALYLENHDQPRAVSRFVHDDTEHRVDSAKLIAIFLGTGTWKNTRTLTAFDIGIFTENDDEAARNSYKVEYQKKSRDNARTPMQWDASPNAGFTTADAKPWMRVNDNYKEINAASQTSDPNSVYGCYRKVLQRRKEFLDIFVYGNFQLVDESNEKVFAYSRRAGNGETALIVCNFTTDTVAWSLPGKTREVLVSSAGRTVDDLNSGETKTSTLRSLCRPARVE